MTVFTRSAVPRLAKLGLPAVKVASYDCASYPLLRDVKEVWDTIYLSTGSMFRREIERAAAELSATSLTLLHCVTLYPTPMDRLNLSRLQWLRSIVGRVGFSDHTLVVRDGILASKVALSLGADVVERHFTVLPSEATKDGPVSITPEQLRELRQFSDLSVEQRRREVGAEASDLSVVMGQPDVEPGPEELLNRDYYQGRVASWVAGRPVYNWEDVDLGVLSQFSDVSGARKI